MANSYFQFKQFRINQDQCGMKVTTDACLFGAYIAEKLHNTNGQFLDIGTGTGLLTLMLAQKSKATIDAIEIEANAYEQAKSNFESSPWHDRISLKHISFQDFVNENQEGRYDHIICNPPFFSRHLSGQNETKNKAVHDEDNLLTELTRNIGSLLSSRGQFHVLLPAYEMSVFAKSLSEYSLFPQSELAIYQREHKPVFRSIVSFGKDKVAKPESLEMVIHEVERDYSSRFIELLMPYYLHLAEKSHK